MQPSRLKFHHIGYACRNIDAEAKRLSLLGYVPEGEDFDDFTQRIRGRFVVGPGPRLELLVQHEGASVLDPWLSKGVKMYHLAYEVDDLSLEIETMRLGGSKVVVAPTPAVAFFNREISFLLMPNMLLVELIQADVSSGSSLKRSR
jgi:methylmalonyl-CoA/ethylmalonyl-CoA epimerase